MSKFSSDIANAVREYMKDPIFLTRMQYPAAGKIFWVKKSTSTGYTDFVKEHPAYENAVPAVYTTITAGMAALNDYDVLIITAGNYDEAGTVTLTSKKGVKIIGTNSGMQWGEGETCWRDVTSTLDLFNLTGNQGVEIAGINFVIVTATKDAINFTGLNYSVHIHHCTFTGDVGGGAVMVYGVNAAGSNGPDTYIHDCKFFRVKTSAIVMGDQRCVIKDNVFIVPAAGKGISNLGGAASYNVIADNYFLGANSTDIGIYSAADTAGLTIIVNNRFANMSSEIEVSKDENCVDNYYADAATGGGAMAAANPEE